ncbi:unnamed protein product [Nezara viridula]|uniref:Uncharacterized protein n=1 Tax=Nezara viridula TaxID=85310 RepID=A0A9P0ED41_NEZVI|nr:unnamed protein product [Nezara viridula]
MTRSFVEEFRANLKRNFVKIKEEEVSPQTVQKNYNKESRLNRSTVRLASLFTADQTCGGNPEPKHHKTAPLSLPTLPTTVISECIIRRLRSVCTPLPHPLSSHSLISLPQTIPTQAIPLVT